MAIFNWKIHYKWQFSIAMLNYQRAYDVWALWNGDFFAVVKLEW